MNLRNASLTCLLVFLAHFAGSQTYNPNIDFEMGSTNYWHYYTGSCCPINTSFSTPPVFNRHTLTSGTATDPYGGFPIVSPDGGTYSLRLGNDINGSEAEKARYYIHVPTGVSDYSLIYRYAVVFEDPGHLPSQQPRFEVHAYDSITSVAIPCAQFTYVADSTLPGFHRALIGTDVYYKDWSSGSINLSGLGGSTIIIDFATADCGLGAHFGYGYVDMSSGLFTVTTTHCDTDSISLNAPPGFNLYSWYDSTTGLLVDTAQSIRIPNPVSTVTFMLVMQPYPGYGCPDTLFSRVVPSHLRVDPGRDTTVCPGDTVMLSVSATDIALPLTYSWSSVGTVSCSTCDTVYVSVTTSTQYIVTVTNTVGCTKTDTFRVSASFGLDTLYNKTLCIGDSTSLSVHPYGLFGPFTYEWSPATGLSCSSCQATIANPPATTTYVVTVHDTIGCTLRDTVHVFRDDLMGGPAAHFTICQGVSVTLSAGATGTSLPFSYSWFPTVDLSCAVCPNPTASCPASTVYTAAITDSTGCSVKDTVLVSVNYLSLSVMGDTAICAGDSFTVTTATSANALPLTWQWSPTANLSCANCPNPVVTANTDCSYTVHVTDTSGCTADGGFSISAHHITVTPQNDTTICRGFPRYVYVNAVGNSALTYSWLPVEGLECPTCQGTNAFAQETTTYLYTVTDNIGCSATDSTTVDIDPCDITVPNAFTPNGDGLNDFFKVYGHLNYFTDYSMSLYNRWGERVFYSEDIHAGWNGEYNGFKADLGTYCYMILYTLYDKKHMLKGNFELVR